MRKKFDELNQFEVIARSTRNQIMVLGGFARTIRKRLDEPIPDKHQIEYFDVLVSEARNLEGALEQLLRQSEEFEASQVIRSIEFEPQYYQAGLGILNFFGSYLREQYPNEEAAVKIEQNGLKVRLIITTEGGRTETIEKALREYELIVTGQEPPERFTKNDKLVLELKNELRVAQFRIESQKEILSIQNARIDKLISIIGEGLANNKPITIDFKPTLTATSNIHLNQNISLALSGLSEIKDLLTPSSEAYIALDDLEKSLETIEKENNPDKVRKSAAMSKFRRVLEKFAEKESTLRKAIDVTERGWELIKDLAGKYNKIAEWCGLPQVPSIFT